MNKVDSKSTIEERFIAGITCPGDVITIRSTSGMICNTISIVVTNPSSSDKFYKAIPNKIESWKWLKMFNDIGGRKVMYQVDNSEPINFIDSEPYKYRFGRR